MSSGIARTRLIDDWLDEAVVQGIRQIVLLGAGYDCRASRLAGLADCRILEIDHPATQAHKKACLQTLDRSMPDNVDYLAADLTERNPDTVWECAGLEKNTPVFVLWEGVTHYLGEEAVNATLRVLSRVCARGSLLVFTYLDRALLDGSRVFPGASIARKRVALGNEPWIWGMDPVMLPHYLSERGFELVEDLEADAYRALYWGDAAKRLKGFGFYHVALARTKDQA
jgi:methyltransferase (TIGR00027 family)